MTQEETADAIKLMIIGSLLAEYGSRLIVDDTKRDLKMRIRGVINAVKNVELHFINHSQTTDHFRQAFKRAFNSNETVLLSELNLITWSLTEEGIEEIIKAVKIALEPENISV